MEPLRSKVLVRDIFIRCTAVTLALCLNTAHSLAVKADDPEAPKQTFERLVGEWAKSRKAIVSGVVKSQVVRVGKTALSPVPASIVIQKLENWNGKA